MSANDNAPEDIRNVKPIVRVPRRRPDAPYAVAANVILPLRFAERMPGWAAFGGTAKAPAPPSGRAL